MHLVTTRSPHKCSKCGQIMPAKTCCYTTKLMPRLGSFKNVWEHIECPQQSETILGVFRCHNGQVCRRCGKPIEYGTKGTCFQRPVNGKIKYVWEHTDTCPQQKETQMELFDLTERVVGLPTPDLKHVKHAVDKELDARKLPDWGKPGQWIWPVDTEDHKPTAEVVFPRN